MILLAFSSLFFVIVFNHIFASVLQNTHFCNSQSFSPRISTTSVAISARRISRAGQGREERVRRRLSRTTTGRHRERREKHVAWAGLGWLGHACLFAEAGPLQMQGAGRNRARTSEQRACERRVMASRASLLFSRASFLPLLLVFVPPFCTLVLLLVGWWCSCP
jgi:hypothetical protein